MTAALIVVAAILVVLLLGTIFVFNMLVRARNAVKNSWALVDTELQRRHDLVPNLVEVVRGYAAHERAVLDEVTAARTAAVQAAPTVEARTATEGALVTGVQKLFAVAEGYPELKAGEQFLELQRQLADAEDRIAVARRVFNANVRDYDTAIESFPGVLLAKGRFERAEPFTVSEAERNAPPPSVA
jgi:LemA protein